MSTPFSGAPAICAVQMYGWDPRSSTWHGPNELRPPRSSSSRLAGSLRSALGHSWYGPVKCGCPGDPETRFFTVCHRMPDCATAMIYCDDSKTGPAEIVTAIPSVSRPRLRPDFAFEFLAFARFLGAVGEGSELHVHDAINAALVETPPADSLVFSLASGLWPADTEYVLSECVEKVAFALLDWQT